MNINKEMSDLLVRWSEHCHEKGYTKSDFFEGAGKATGSFIAAIVLQIDGDEETCEEALENYVKNVERFAMVILEKYKAKFNG